MSVFQCGISEKHPGFYLAGGLQILYIVSLSYLLMRFSGFLRALIILLVLSSNISCDQLSKSYVRQAVNEFETISLFNNYITVMKVENTGAFLSLGNTLPVALRLLLLVFLPVLVLGFGVYFIFRKQDLGRTTLFGICCVLGGGIGNIFDRIMYGSVTDVLHIDFVLFQTGVFNLADVSIMAGVFIVLIDSYRKKTLPA
jgi:signal peptidase II